MSSRKAQREEVRAKREAALREAAARERRRRRLWLFGGILAAAATVVVVAIVVSSSAPKKLKPGVRPPQAAEVAAMFKGIPQHGQTLGKPNAPLTLVEFAH